VITNDFLAIADATCVVSGEFVYVVGGTNGEEKLKTIIRISLVDFRAE